MWGSKSISFVPVTFGVGHPQLQAFSIYVFFQRRTVSSKIIMISHDIWKEFSTWTPSSARLEDEVGIQFGTIGDRPTGDGRDDWELCTNDREP